MTTPINKTTPSARDILDTNFHERNIDLSGWRKAFPREAAAIEASLREIAQLSWEAGRESEGYNFKNDCNCDDCMQEKARMLADKETFLTNLFKE